MSITKISIEDFIKNAHAFTVIDVRSPGEYKHAHILGAESLPLFTDEERKIVGTSYKQQSKETAIKIGLDFFGVKMRKMVEEVEGICNRQLAMDKQKAKIDKKSINQKPNNHQSLNILVHCWRGGMRSAGVAWLLDLYGFKIYILMGGYKAYRTWVLQQFEKDYRLKIIGGYTGSGKTPLLHHLQKNNFSIIDLEGLANHKGSAFGALGQPEQPTQEMFENLLATKLFSVFKPGNEIVKTNELEETRNEGQETGICFIEDESQRIGKLNIPPGFWKTMRAKPVYFIDIPFEKRLDYITEEYGGLPKEELINAIIRIQKRLGGLETKLAIGFLVENNYKECFSILLKYYDKHYKKSLGNRENLKVLLRDINCDNVDPVLNANNVLKWDIKLDLQLK